MIDVSELSIEETAQRVIRTVEQRTRDAQAVTVVSRDLREKGSVPLRYWALLVDRAGGSRSSLFYVLLTPIWMGIRVAGWLAARARRRVASEQRAASSGVSEPGSTR